MLTILYIFLEYFLVYSFLGWCTEVVYHAVSMGKVINRGFMNGPWCPIYGVGVIAVFRLLEALGGGELQKQNALMIFIIGLVLSTGIELVGGWALDKLFHARWWDYSDRPFNLHGYICLEFALIWGLGILLVVRGVNPMITNVLDYCPVDAGWVLIIIFSILFASDLVVSVMIMVGLNKRMAELDEMRREMRVVSDSLSERLGSGALETAQRLDEAKVQAALAKAEMRDQTEKIRADYEAKRRELEQRLTKSRHFGTGRLLRAFPDMKHRKYPDMLSSLKKQITG